MDRRAEQEEEDEQRREARGDLSQRMGEEVGSEEDERNRAQRVPVIAEPLACREPETPLLAQALVEPYGMEGIFRGIVEVGEVAEIDLLGPRRDQAEPAG